MTDPPLQWLCLTARGWGCLSTLNASWQPVLSRRAVFEKQRDRASEHLNNGNVSVWLVLLCSLVPKQDLVGKTTPIHARGKAHSVPMVRTYYWVHVLHTSRLQNVTVGNLATIGNTQDGTETPKVKYIQLTFILKIISLIQCNEMLPLVYKLFFFRCFLTN